MLNIQIEVRRDPYEIIAVHHGIIASKKDIGLLVFRILIGLAFIWHGVPKLLSGPEGWNALGSMMGALGIHIFPTFFGLLSGMAETFGGLFILLGLFYRPMALFLVGNLMMATPSSSPPAHRFFRPRVRLRKAYSSSASSSPALAAIASTICFTMKSVKKSVA